MSYLRDGHNRESRLQLEPTPRVQGAELDARLRGAVFTELDAGDRARGLSGVLLESLERDSRLAYEGLRPGDVITAVNRQRVHSMEAFQALLVARPGRLLLQLRRGGEAYIARID